MAIEEVVAERFFTGRRTSLRAGSASQVPFHVLGRRPKTKTLVTGLEASQAPDTAPATVDALGPIADAVGGRAEVIVDGGIRRGADVLKAIALGARAVQIGRPIVWGLVVDGEGGVGDVLGVLREEFDLAMALTGCRSVDEITSDVLAP